MHGEWSASGPGALLPVERASNRIEVEGEWAPRTSGGSGIRLLTMKWREGHRR